VIVAIVAAVAALDGIVDPRNEFYSGDALTAALAANCLLADDVVRSRSYADLKHDLFLRLRPKRVVLAADGVKRRGLDLGYPGFGAADVRAMVGFLSKAAPARLRVVVVTQPSWFDRAARGRSNEASALAKLGYLLSPWTLGATLDLMRRSRELAFTGWQKERLDGRCVVDRGSPSPAFRPDGTFTAPNGDGSGSATGDFAYERLGDVDAALGLAEDNGWRVAGISTLRGSDVYRTQLKALFAKHGYRWRVRTMAA
jgi:hypothetical protein